MSDLKEGDEVFVVLSKGTIQKIYSESSEAFVHFGGDHFDRVDIDDCVMNLESQLKEAKSVIGELLTAAELMTIKLYANDCVIGDKIPNVIDKARALLEKR